MRTILAIALLAISLTALAQTPGTTQWENDSLDLRLSYPSTLIKQDPGQVMQDGNFTLFGISGISGAAGPKLAEATKCLRPMLLLELPHSGTAALPSSQPAPAVTATVLLAELDVECLSNQQSNSTSLLAGLAGIVNKVPGMTSIARPSTYTIGWQKVYMAAAQGQPRTEPKAQPNSAASQPSTPQQLFTMGISTNWKSHLLVWYFSSNNIDTLNRITKTTVRFGRAQAAPLYPVVIGTTAP